MPDYDDRIEVPMAHKVSRLAIYWKYSGRKPDPIGCICCGDNAIGVYYCPFGTEESINIVQPLCKEHKENFEKFKNEMYVLEDFI